MEIQLSNFLESRYNIYVDFHILRTSIRGILTNVEGPLSLAPKKYFIHSLEKLSHWVGKKHWILGGYFNLIHSLRDRKKGGIRSLNPANMAFDTLINELSLIYISTANSLFTWNNKCSGDRHIISRLDHFLISESILSGGTYISTLVLSVVGLDH